MSIACSYARFGSILADIGIQSQVHRFPVPTSQHRRYVAVDIYIPRFIVIVLKIEIELLDLKVAGNIL